MRSTPTPAAETTSSMATSAGWSRPALAPGVRTSPATPRARALAALDGVVVESDRFTGPIPSGGGPGGQLDRGALLLARRVDPTQGHVLPGVVSLDQV